MTASPVHQQSSRAQGCLRCHHADQSVSVAAVVREGRRTGVARGSMPGRFGYDVPIEARVELTTALARALTPPMKPRSVTKPAIAFSVSGALALWDLQLAVLNPVDGTAWFGLLFFSIVALGSGWLLRARHRDLQVTGPVVNDAWTLWRRSWYCRRCGVVSVYTPGGATVVNVQGFTSALMDLARQGRRTSLRA